MLLKTTMVLGKNTTAGFLQLLVWNCLLSWLLLSTPTQTQNATVNSTYSTREDANESTTDSSGKQAVEDPAREDANESTTDSSGKQAVEDSARNSIVWEVETALGDPDKALKAWMDKHGSVVTSSSNSRVTLDARKKLFIQRLKEAKEINDKKLGWTAGITQFTGLTLQEQKQFLGWNGPKNWKASPVPDNVIRGYLKKIGSPLSVSQAKKLASSSVSPDGKSTSRATANTLPYTLDWRKTANRVTPVKNQGGCGSCWAFAAIAAFESAVHKQYNKTGVDLSEQEALDCSRAGLNSCQIGGSPQDVWELLKLRNATDETLYKYVGTQTCCKLPHDWKKQKDNIRVKNYFTYKGETAVKEAVAQHPVAVCFSVDTDFMSYKSGIYTPKNKTCPATVGGHCVLLVGYNYAWVKRKVGFVTIKLPQWYWIFKNSWGTSFGPNSDGYGHFAMGGGSTGYCGISGWATAPEVEGGCFPNAATVRMEDGTVKRMDEVRIGERVHVGMSATDRPAFDDVYLIINHNTPLQSYLRLKLITESGASHQLLVTANHFVFKQGPGKPTAVAAQSLATGDRMLFWNANSMSWEPSVVMAVEYSVEEGAITLITLSGRIVVDGVLASSFADWPMANGKLLFSSLLGSEQDVQGVSQALFFPVRVLYRMLGPSATSAITGGAAGAVSGIAKWAAAVHSANQESAWHKATVHGLLRILHASSKFLGGQ